MKSDCPRVMAKIMTTGTMYYAASHAAEQINTRNKYEKKQARLIKN